MEAYTKDYYKEINRLETDQARAVARVLNDLYHPQTVIDLGCGTGLYLAPFDCLKFGIDISPEAFDPEVLQVAPNEVGVEDLRKPLIVDIKSDIAICFEVVEHIGNEYEQVLVDNICKFSDTIIMTSAPPGQAGLNHVNCEPQKHWDSLFEARGFKRDYHDEYQIVSEVVKVPHTVWIIRNLMVYKR